MFGQAQLAALFILTLFWSAALLFCVQPMVGKMLLPQLGGAPAVWNTCMVFFQAVLLAGYACAHWMATRLRSRQQLGLHLAVLLVAFFTVPISLADAAASSKPWETSPILWLLGTLTIAVGPVFFALAVTAPLLQRWFAASAHPAARDPYFLYAASNLGSFTALLGYPLLIEPTWRLSQQSRLWTYAFMALPLLVLVCGWRVFFAGPRPSKALRENVRVEPADPGYPEGSSRSQRAWWAVYAAVPSALLLGVTSYITTDVASVPLFWVVPLALYLLTFVLVFAKRQIFAPSLVSRVLPFGAIAMVYQLCVGLTEPAWLVLSLPLLVFFLAAMVCHGRLAASRPAPEQLTRFYLWMSIGGVLGGMFSALAAPFLFRHVIEYPLALVFACWLRPNPKPNIAKLRVSMESLTRFAAARSVFPELGAAACIGALTALLAAQLPRTLVLPQQLQSILIFGMPLLLSFLLVDRPRGFALALGALLMGSSFFSGGVGRTLHMERNFFGVSRVTLSPNGDFRQFVHGRTIHGRQFLDLERAGTPLTFFHPAGPVGDIFANFRTLPVQRTVGVIGLGVGSMAAYARPDESWTFYDIDPSVLRIAQDTHYFTFLARACAANLRLVEGDARLRLHESPSANYGLFAIDAFTSDAIPMHLITREALELYLDKLADGGLLVFHISNRYLDLEPVLGNVAQDLHLAALGWDDNNLTPADYAAGRERSFWVVMARKSADLAGFAHNQRWQRLRPRASVGVWTDDFSSPLKVFVW